MEVGLQVYDHLLITSIQCHIIVSHQKFILVMTYYM